MKKIFVCGDSFCSADTTAPGTHFSEILSTMGYNIRNLARGGITNTGICFQIKEAINQKADLVIFTSTSSDRLDITLKEHKGFLSLKNFIYPYSSDLSSADPLVGKIDSSIYSDVIPALLNPRPDLPKKLLSKDQQQAIQMYITYLHDYKMKQEIDSWIISYWKTQVKTLHLNFLPAGQMLFDYVNQNPTKINQAVYHTDFETQQKVAEELRKDIDKILN